MFLEQIKDKFNWFGLLNLPQKRFGDRACAVNINSVIPRYI